jgi:Ser/Thr protein kinase RdoA (MazF antagonist)
MVREELVDNPTVFPIDRPAMTKMRANSAPIPLRAVYSRIAGDEIRKQIKMNYSLGNIENCALLQAGFNDIYEVSLVDGCRYIARLGSRLKRGVPNVSYETSLLQHLKQAGADVAARWPTKHNALFVDVPCQEGIRPLVVLDFLPGDMPKENLDDIRAMAAELARIHLLSKDYSGPKSEYVLDLDHLLRRPLARILALDAISQETRDLLASVAQELEGRAARFSNLTLVACHGDCHGYNTMMSAAPDGSRVASFFDFDDGGPGYLAYDLAVFLWNRLLSRQLAQPDEKVQAVWASFIEGYRSVTEVPAVDYEAISMFVAIRHLWLVGEYASQVECMGLQVFRSPWIRNGFDLVQKWLSLETPQV